MALSISTKEQDGRMVVAPAGEVDVSNAAELRDAIDSALAKGDKPVELDMADVTYIDSTGIGVLVGAAHRASEGGTTFSVARPQRNVARVLDLLGVTKELNVRA